jgi:hypothetical protein
LTGLYIALHKTDIQWMNPSVPIRKTNTTDTHVSTDQLGVLSEDQTDGLSKSASPSTKSRETPVQEIITSFFPKSAKAGNYVKLFVRLPEGKTISMHIGGIYFQGRLVPRKEHEKENVIEVLIPGDAKGVGYFEVDYEGQRIRVHEPFTVEPVARRGG